MDGSGKIITIEGINGVGKTTQAQLLADALKERAGGVRLFKYPEYDTPTGEVIRYYLDGGFGPKEELFELAAVLYAADRAKNTAIYQTLLREGVLIIHDRYREANWGIQTALFTDPAVREAKLQWLMELEKNLHPSDLVILLDLPEETAHDLLAKRGELDQHEMDMGFMRAARSRYLELGQRFGWKTVDCAEGDEIKSRQIIHQEVLQLVQDFLSATT